MTALGDARFDILVLAACCALPVRAWSQTYVEVTPPSSRVTASADDGNGPGNAVDGDPGTRWSASGDGQWLTLDLGAQHTVGRVKLSFHKGDSRSSRFELQVSGDGSSWRTVLTARGAGDTTALETFDLPDAPARYVRYLGRGNSANAWNSVTEVEVFAVAAPPTGVFRHPGVLVNRAQLDFVRDRVSRGIQPWKAGFDALAASSYAAPSWTPKPRAVVECGPSSNPNLGCSDERNDALAAYTQALLWFMTRDEAHARKSIEIMNAWGRTVQDHTGHNARLQTGWAGSVFPRAAEILRYTYGGWAAADVERFKATLRNVYLPEIIAGSPGTNGNWELIMIEAIVNISVFIDDRASFDKGVSMWRRRVPAYIYLASDGAHPVPPPGGGRDTAEELIDYWQGQSRFVDGLAQETCRDFGHTLWGFAAAIDAAETARQQGVDLYAEQSRRLRTGLEFHADYILGKPAPSWLCNGRLKLAATPTWEIAYNHYHDRLGLALPLSRRVIEEKVRPTGANYFIAWETLTHAAVAGVGLP